jgi:hypothetical protein
MKMFHNQVPKIVLGFCLFGTALNIFSAETQLPYREIGPGVHYVNKSVHEVPWSIHVIKIDRHRGDLKLTTTLAKGTIFGLSSLIEQVGSISPKIGTPVAGINGDFYLISKKPYQGDPQGLQILDGELVSAPSENVCFWMEGTKPKIGKVNSRLKVIWPNGKETRIGLNQERKDDEAVLLTPTLGESTRTTNGIELVLEWESGPWLPLRAGKTYSTRVREIHGTNTPLAPGILILSLGPMLQKRLEIQTGIKLKISTATLPSVAKARMAIGGGPALVRDGKILAQTVGKERNPRTAFGWNDSDFFFVVVDGRRKDVSNGMTFAELAEEMAALGCDEAMNLDGGGSATIWGDGKVLNQPSDNRNRSLANALICIREPRKR